jgi:dihydroflavonol-4-reductase
MSVLVTGATGFLGRHLLQTLSRDGGFGELIVLVRDKREWERLPWARDLNNVVLLEGHVLDADRWQDDPCLAGLQGVFHLAALVKHSRRNTDEVFKVNIEGTRNMVRVAALHGCRMVFVSTSGTVGCFRNEAAHADEGAPYCEHEVGSWPYYASKIKAEQAAQKLARESGVELVIVRPPIMLGPGDHRFRSTGHVIRFLRRRLPFLIRGGIHFVDIRDAASALLAAMKHPAPKPVYHLQGTSCSIERFFGQLEEISGVPQPRFHLPYRLAWGLAKADEWLGMRLKGEPLSLLPDPVVVEMATRYWDVRSNYAAEDLGFVSRDAKETLTDTVRWLRQNRGDC